MQQDVANVDLIISIVFRPAAVVVTMQNRWNNRISDGCVYAQIRKGLGMHLVTYLNHDTVPFLLIVPIKDLGWNSLCLYLSTLARFRYFS